MSLLFTGMFLLVLTIFVVMGVPFTYYFKRDLKWEAAKNPSLDLWYE